VVLAEPETRLDPLLQHDQPLLLQAGDRRTSERLPTHVGEGRSPPQPERLGEQSDPVAEVVGRPSPFG
jgi:hypothetical protein